MPASGSACEKQLAVAPQPRRVETATDSIRVEVDPGGVLADETVQQLTQRLAAQEALTGNLAAGGAVLKVEGLKR
jgi:hypothetical protein